MKFRDSHHGEIIKREDNYDRRINYNEGGVEWAYQAISALFRRFKASFLQLVSRFRNCNDRQVNQSALIMLSLLI